MDTNQVRALLGDPTSTEVFTNAEGTVSTSWFYSRSSRWKFVTVSFGGDGKFQGHYED